MDLTSPVAIKQILKKRGIKPNKVLGQNFLIDKNILKKIIDSADIKTDDTIVEVGPGIGTLTKELAERAAQVIAVEKDKKMCGILMETMKNYGNLEIINADILKIEPFSNFKLNSNFKFQISNYKVVANIPYYLTSPLIRKFLESDTPPSEMVLMLQKEVAQRICAKPPKMNLLAISVQFYVYPVKSASQSEAVSREARQFNRAGPKIISYVSKNCFWPAPKVDSAIIKITLRPRRCEKGEARRSNLFFTIVKAGFSHPRKQILGNLSKGLEISKKTAKEWLEKNNISPSQRAETLTVEDWKNLAETLPKW